MTGVLVLTSTVHIAMRNDDAGIEKTSSKV
jgi:hypothetical protein